MKEAKQYGVFDEDGLIEGGFDSLEAALESARDDYEPGDEVHVCRIAEDGVSEC